MHAPAADLPVKFVLHVGADNLAVADTVAALDLAGLRAAQGVRTDVRVLDQPLVADLGHDALAGAPAVLLAPRRLLLAALAAMAALFHYADSGTKPPLARVRCKNVAAVIRGPLAFLSPGRGSYVHFGEYLQKKPSHRTC